MFKRKRKRASTSVSRLSQRLSKLSLDDDDNNGDEDVDMDDGAVTESEVDENTDVESDEEGDPKGDDDDERELPEHPANRRDPFPCLSRSSVENRGFQRDVGKRVKTSNRLALWWGMGLGKTHGGVLGAECAREESRALEDKDRLVVVITKVSLKENFREGLRKYGHSDAYIDRHYRFYGFEEASKGQHHEQAKIDCRDAIIVIDESHELRGWGGVRARAIASMVASCWKLLTLTGTPLVNGVEDLYSTAEMFTSDPVGFRRTLSSPKALKNYPFLSDDQRDALDEAFMCKVSYQDPPKPRKGFPSTTEINLLIEMEPKYLARYRALEEERLEATYQTRTGSKKPTVAQLLQAAKKEEGIAFYSGLRQALNGIKGTRNQKLDFIVGRAVHNASQKPARTMAVFSFFKDAGLVKVEKALEKSDVLYTKITGDVPETKRNKQRTENLRAFNAREVTVLLLSEAGATGTNAGGASEFINMEPTWTRSEKDQAIARVVRSDGEEKFPKGIPPHVTIYNLFLCKPEDIPVYQARMLDDAKNKRPGAPDEVRVVWAAAAAKRKAKVNGGTTKKKKKKAVRRPRRSLADLFQEVERDEREAERKAARKQKGEKEEDEPVDEPKPPKYLPSIDLHMYDLQRAKADRIDAFLNDFMKRWAIETNVQCVPGFKYKKPDRSTAPTAPIPTSGTKTGGGRTRGPPKHSARLVGTRWW